MKLRVLIHGLVHTILIICLMTQTFVYSQTLEKEYHEESVRLPHLHIAAQSGDYNEVERLLSVGADPNEVDILYMTPLDHAVWGNHDDIVALLLAAGSSVEKKLGRDALQGALQTESESIAKKLIRARAPLNERDEAGNTLVHWAVDFGPKVVNLLLKFKPQLDAKNDRGQTALHRAAETGSSNVTKILIKNGALINETDAEGKTPRDYAVAAKNKKLVKLFDLYLSKSKEEL